MTKEKIITGFLERKGEYTKEDIPYLLSAVQNVALVKNYFRAPEKEEHVVGLMLRELHRIALQDPSSYTSIIASLKPICIPASKEYGPSYTHSTPILTEILENLGQSPPIHEIFSGLKSDDPKDVEKTLVALELLLRFQAGNLSSDLFLTAPALIPLFGNFQSMYAMESLPAKVLALMCAFNPSEPKLVNSIPFFIQELDSRSKKEWDYRTKADLTTFLGSLANLANENPELFPLQKLSLPLQRIMGVGRVHRGQHWCSSQALIEQRAVSILASATISSPENPLVKDEILPFLLSKLRKEHVLWEKPTTRANIMRADSKFAFLIGQIAELSLHCTAELDKAVPTLLSLLFKISQLESTGLTYSKGSFKNFERSQLVSAADSLNGNILSALDRITQKRPDNISILTELGLSRKREERISQPPQEISKETFTEIDSEREESREAVTAKSAHPWDKNVEIYLTLAVQDMSTLSDYFGLPDENIGIMDRLLKLTVSSSNTEQRIAIQVLRDILATDTISLEEVRGTEVLRIMDSVLTTLLTSQDEVICIPAALEFTSRVKESLIPERKSVWKQIEKMISEKSGPSANTHPKSLEGISELVELGKLSEGTVNPPNERKLKPLKNGPNQPKLKS